MASSEDYYPAIYTAFERDLTDGGTFNDEDKKKKIGKPRPNWNLVTPVQRGLLLGRIFPVLNGDPVYGDDFKRIDLENDIALATKLINAMEDATVGTASRVIAREVHKANPNSSPASDAIG